MASGGYSSVVVHRLLIAVLSLGEHRFQGMWALQHGLSSCGSWASLSHGMWNLPGPGTDPVSLALAGGFLTTGPPGEVLLESPGRKFSAAAAAKSLQSCPTLCDPIDGLLPGSSVPGILQARTLEWVAISFSNA